MRINLMEPGEVKDAKETLQAVSAVASDAPGAAAPASELARSVRAAQSCPTCGTAAAANTQGATPNYIYAIGRIEPRFPRPSVEKELAQATGRAETVGLTDRQALQKVLSQRCNRYLA